MSLTTTEGKTEPDSDLEIRSYLQTLVRDGRTEELGRLIEDGLPISRQAGKPAACVKRITDLLLAYKDFAGECSPQVFDAWIEKIRSTVSATELHSHLCSAFLAIVGNVWPSKEGARALLDAIEKIEPDFLVRPVDEPQLSGDLNLTEMRRAWKPGQTRRTILGILADCPRWWHDRGLWATILPERMTALPAATSTMHLLEYLSRDVRESRLGNMLRERYVPRTEDYGQLAQWAINRLRKKGLALAPEEATKKNILPPATPNALGAIFVLEAGPTLSGSEWREVAMVTVRTRTSSEPVTLPHALALEVALAKSMDTLCSKTILQMLDAGALAINGAIDGKDTTLLHIAACGRNSEFVGALLSLGADPRAMNLAGNKPSDLAGHAGPSAVRLALDAGAARYAMLSAFQRRSELDI